jgi:hypothetical protein
VTAAHEYFHAVQFAYDAAEDPWFMEASATWVEDELFDDVDDNVFYLPKGQLGQPGTPLDKFTGLFHYGNWIYLRYLTERYPTEAGGLPVLVRDLWDKVDAAEPTDPDMYAVQALKSALAARGTTFTATYARFAEAGRRRTSFTEGVANSYPVKPLASSKTLTPAASTTGTINKVLQHLSSATYRITPGTRLTASDWRVKLALDLPATGRGSAAVVTVYKKSGAVSVVTVPLTSAGDASRSYAFSRGTVKYVEVTLVNASTRFDCWLDPQSPFSCSGASGDDGLTFKLRATAYRA